MQGETKYLRKIIRITADDSPNVRFAREQIARGLEVTNEEIIPNVLTWAEYQYRRRIWDPVRQCIGLDAQFYKGADVLMYPPEWLNRAEQLAIELAMRRQPRLARAIGCDPGEGGANSSWSVIDEYGLIKQINIKTPNTSDVPKQTIQLMREFNVPADRTGFDGGGGGKQHADLMRSMGYNVRIVRFGESLQLEPKRGIRFFEEKKEIKEVKYEFINRRAQMAWEIRELLDPSREEGMGFSHDPREMGFSWGKVTGFAIPAKYVDLRKQMAVIPLKFDKEGRIKLPQKNRTSENSKEKTLVELCGRSPDEWDSLMVAVHMLLHKPKRMIAGAA